MSIDLSAIEDRVRERATDVFENASVAEEWLRSPCPALGGRVPIRLFEEAEGLRVVLAELTAIEHGLPP